MGGPLRYVATGPNSLSLAGQALIMRRKGLVTCLTSSCLRHRDSCASIRFKINVISHEDNY